MAPCTRRPPRLPAATRSAVHTTGTCPSPAWCWGSRTWRSPRRTASDRRDAVAAIAERAILATRQLEPAHHLTAQIREVDDRVDDELGRQPQQVDVLFVDASLLGHEHLALGFVGDRRDLVRVHRVHG